MSAAVHGQLVIRAFCYPNLVAKQILFWTTPPLETLETFSCLQVKSFTLRGLASDVDVQLESVDGLNANAPTSPAKRVSGAGMGPAALVTRGSLDLATQVGDCRSYDVQ